MPPPRAGTLRHSVLAAVAEPLDSPGRPAVVSTLAGHDPEHVRIVVGALLRTAIEETHADGLDEDDVRDVLRRTATTGVAAGLPVDAAVLAVVISGALGVLDADDTEGAPAGRLSAVAMAHHAALLTRTVVEDAPRTLPAYLDEALAEILRAETIELP